MAFVFQQPGMADLLGQIDIAAENAMGGGGVFAFASRCGVEALFECQNFIKMLTKQRPFLLIVGVDAVTNAETLLCLIEKKLRFPTLTVEAFYHEHPNSTFHPKFSWFEQDNSLCLLTGSGNLTRRGVGHVSSDTPPAGNWEAFSVQTLRTTEATTVHDKIYAWLADHREIGTLLPITNENVMNKAMSNGLIRFAKAPRRPIHGEQIPSMVAVPVDGVAFETPEILIREIPQNRLGQADVGRRALKEFFGYEEGRSKMILLQHVSFENDLGPVLEVQLFVNQSRNYRLELRAIANLGYTIAQDGGRMFLIATKLDRRSFRYTVLPTDAEDYPSFVAALFDSTSSLGVRGRPMRETRISPDQLSAAWPKVPSNLVPFGLLMPEP